MLTLAGIIVFLYAVSSILGLWLSSQVTKVLEGEGEVPEALAETPQHHLDLMANYSMGWRAAAWRISIAALVTSLVALAFSSSLAFWALGVSLALKNIPNVRVPFSAPSPWLALVEFEGPSADLVEKVEEALASALEAAMRDVPCKGPSE